MSRGPTILLAILAPVALAAGCSQGAGGLGVSITAPEGDVTVLVGSSAVFESSISGGTKPYDVSWHFGGGAASVSGEDPGAVAFTVRGTFQASCTVKDAWGAEASDTVTVRVKDLVARIASPADGIQIGEGDSLDFQGDVLGGTPPYACSWDFAGNAPASVLEDPGLIAFHAPATFTASLTVTDGVADTDTATIEVTVLGGFRGHSREAVKAYWNAIQPTRTTVSYATAPVLAVDDTGYEGVLDPPLVDEGIAWVNFYRWLAGLPDTVAEDATFRVRCQKGAHVLVMLEILNQSYSSPHNPPLPTGSSAAYEANVYGGPATTSGNTGGWIACASSNVYRGWGGSAYTPVRCVDGYMDDQGNDSTLGHRRWILYPRLSLTAFGTVWGGSDWASCMYVVERPSFTAPAFDFVAYPSQGFHPTQCWMRSAALWSFSANSAKYDLDASTTAEVVRQSDGQNLPVTTAVMPAGYGITPTIRFDPNESTKDETYRVAIRGVLDKATSQRFDYEYTVTFFDLTE
jgi:hypothetical protein